jgi:hypothetical protein
LGRPIKSEAFVQNADMRPSAVSAQSNNEFHVLAQLETATIHGESVGQVI